MSQPQGFDGSQVALPPSVMTKKDLVHLINEAEAIDSTLTSNYVRDKAQVDGDIHYETTEKMREFLTINHINMGEGSSRRTETIKALRRLKNNAPSIHLTFAASVDYESLTQIVRWIRDNVEKQAIVSIGLQPGIVGGIHVRTNNKVHDLTLRKQLEKSRDVLIKEVTEIAGGRK